LLNRNYRSNNKNLSLIIIIFVICNILSCKDESTAPPNTINPSEKYTLVWSDEFNGTTLDTSKWDYRDLGPRLKAINVKDAVSLDGSGHLIIRTFTDGNNFYTGMIGTQNKFESTFGYWECRMKVQKQQGHWSAFWLQSPAIGSVIGNPALSGTEIDVVEYATILGSIVEHAIHWDGYGQYEKMERGITTVPDINNNYQTFGLEWTKNEYIFYVNGKETWRTNSAISFQPEYIILSMEVDDWAGDISKAVLPDSLFVDYVRVYQ
jgi:beta-glucanase (GH16 family)